MNLNITLNVNFQLFKSDSLCFALKNKRFEPLHTSLRPSLEDDEFQIRKKKNEWQKNIRINGNYRPTSSTK